jgi:S-methylmethionine-dependent homocysteine/selenocysteine methylase
MPRHRAALPQLDGGLFLTDGGIETTLVFHQGLDLPCFAAFPLLDQEAGRSTLKRYYEEYVAVALELGVGLVLEAATWRANADWGARLGYSAEALAEVNRRAIALLTEIREERENDRSPMAVSGCIGPRGDGYDPTHLMSAAAAADYHREQIETFAGTAANMVSALTLNYVDEAVGIARAAQDSGLPSVISFTVETDGRLPTGQSLGEAIDEVDGRTAAAPAYYMINCAHPAHFSGSLEPGTSWVRRIVGLRANASTLSHAELDEATELDEGNPETLGREYRELRDRFPHLTVLGGCCGTDSRHVEAIGRACTE